MIAIVGNGVGCQQRGVEGLEVGKKILRVGGDSGGLIEEDSKIDEQQFGIFGTKGCKYPTQNRRSRKYQSSLREAILILRVSS